MTVRPLLAWWIVANFELACATYSVALEEEGSAIYDMGMAIPSLAADHGI